MFSVLPKLEKPEGWFFKLNLASTNCSLYSPVRAARERAEDCWKKGDAKALFHHEQKNVTCLVWISYDVSSPFLN